MSIVVGYVPGPLGDATLDAAIEEAKRRHSDLVVLNTTVGDRLVDPRYADEPAVATLRGKLDAAGVPFQLRTGVSGATAADGLVEAAEEIDAELIVIGVRSRSAVGKLLLGSTSQTVLLRSHCPVLAIKA